MSTRNSTLALLIVALISMPAFAQTTRPATTMPTSQPSAERRRSLSAKVIDISGAVEYAPAGADPADPNVWKPVALDTTLEAGMLIRTGLRSHCVLMFGAEPDMTVISVRRATLASVSDFYRTQNEQRVRIGLGYGAVRGGSSEGVLRSDVVIDSTVATLAKRGTEGYELEVDPINSRFRISLAEYGLVTAISKLRHESREVRPGEYVTNVTIAIQWINQALFDRAVRFYDVEMLTDPELHFTSLEHTGYSNLGPAGFELYDLARRGELPIDFNALQQINPVMLAQVETLLLLRRPVSRPEGNFGFGYTFRLLAPRAAARR